MFCFVEKTAFPVLTNSATCIDNNIETILVYFFCIIRSIETQQIFHRKTSSWAVFLLLSMVSIAKDFETDHSFFEASPKYQYCFQIMRVLILDLCKDCQRLCNVLGSKAKILMKEQLLKDLRIHQNLLASRYQQEECVLYHCHNKWWKKQGSLHCSHITYIFIP